MAQRSNWTKQAILKILRIMFALHSALVIPAVVHWELRMGQARIDIWLSQ
jgi:hypothetical protein